MKTLTELMRLVDSLVDAAFATGRASGSHLQTCIAHGAKDRRSAIEHALLPLYTEIDVLRDAVEAAYDFLDTMSSDPDCEDDGTQGAIRATRRQMAEALGKSLPRLLYEKQEGQKMFGLRYRELVEENVRIQDALAKAEEDLRRPQPIETAPQGSLMRAALHKALEAMRRSLRYDYIFDTAPITNAITSAEEALRSPPLRPELSDSWDPPSNYSDAYDWHQYLDKPEEKESQPVNGPGTAVDSRSAACSSSSVPRSQPSGIVSSGAPTPSQATLSNDALQGPVATLHDDGCFTWKRDEFRLKYDMRLAGWRMDVYAYPPELKAPMAWDDRPLLTHCLEAVNAASSAWSDVRNLNGDIDGGKCAAAAALERIAKDRIKELAAQCASPPEPEPEKPAARRLTDEEVEVIVRQQYSTDISPADWARSAIRVAESALATLWGVKLRVWGITLE
jgi:hypothetical protein